MSTLEEWLLQRGQAGEDSRSRLGTASSEQMELEKQRAHPKFHLTRGGSQKHGCHRLIRAVPYRSPRLGELCST